MRLDVQAVVVWYAAAVIQGILGLLLCLGHYDKEFVEKDASKDMDGFGARSPSQDVDARTDGLVLRRPEHSRRPSSHAAPESRRYRDADREIRALLRKHSMTMDKVRSGGRSVLRHMHKDASLRPGRRFSWGRSA